MTYYNVEIITDDQKLKTIKFDLTEEEAWYWVARILELGGFASIRVQI